MEMLWIWLLLELFLRIELEKKVIPKKSFVSLGTSGSYGGSGSTASGPVSIFSNIYKWETYKDPDNNGSGNNGISSKSLLYTMTVKVYYGDETEPMAQVVTTKVG